MFLNTKTWSKICFKHLTFCLRLLFTIYFNTAIELTHPTRVIANWLPINEIFFEVLLQHRLEWINNIIMLKKTNKNIRKSFDGLCFYYENWHFIFSHNLKFWSNKGWSRSERSTGSVSSRREFQLERRYAKLLWEGREGGRGRNWNGTKKMEQ